MKFDGLHGNHLLVQSAQSKKPKETMPKFMNSSNQHILEADPPQRHESAGAVQYKLTFKYVCYSNIMEMPLLSSCSCSLYLLPHSTFGTIGAGVLVFASAYS